MAKKTFHSKARSIVFCVLSFLMSVMLFALSLCVVLTITVFNPQFILDNMDSSNYYFNKCDEITEELIDLGYASGLKEEFFDGLVDIDMLSSDTYTYIQNYYSGNGTKLDTTAFKTSFNTALDEYIKENNITEVNEESREYLLNRVAGIYRNALEIPFFAKLSPYILTAKNAMPFVIIALASLSAVICIVFFVTNKWKHRAVRYICYAAISTILTLAIIPAYVFISGILTKVNLTSRAWYSLFVQCGNSICLTIIFCACLFLLVSVGLFVQYRIMCKKISN